MQNAGIAALKLNWRYLAFEVHPDDLRGAIEGARLMRYVGLNLTVPHKLLAMEIVDVLDESARMWGAVNTVRFEGQAPDGSWRPVADFVETPQKLRTHGFNTDSDAIVRSLSEDLNVTVKGAKVLLLGAGGAGRAAALKLASEQVGELYLVNRSAEKAEAIAAEIKKRWPGVKVTVGYPNGSVELVLNATSLGLKLDDPLPFDGKRFALTQANAVYDMVYRPAETPLLKAAKAAGRRSANGLGMLLYQGAKALELWSGKTAPVSVMRAALEKNIYG